MTPQARRLCWHGALLFLLGLATGAGIPLFANPRMGLSAHLGGVQNGLFLMVLGLLWSHLALSARARRTGFALALVSMYGIWIALVLGAALGTSRTTPIAGAGFAGSPLAEGVVGALLFAGSAAIFVAAGLLLRGLGAAGGPAPEE